jgi:hypothetical protein
MRYNFFPPLKVVEDPDQLKDEDEKLYLRKLQEKQLRDKIKKKLSYFIKERFVAAKYKLDEQNLNNIIIKEQTGNKKERRRTIKIK